MMINNVIHLAADRLSEENHYSPDQREGRELERKVNNPEITQSSIQLKLVILLGSGKVVVVETFS